MILYFLTAMVSICRLSSSKKSNGFILARISAEPILMKSAISMPSCSKRAVSSRPFPRTRRASDPGAAPARVRFPTGRFLVARQAARTDRSRLEWPSDRRQPSSTPADQAWLCPGRKSLEGLRLRWAPQAYRRDCCYGCRRCS